MALRSGQKKSTNRANILAGVSKVYIGRLGASLPEINNVSSGVLDFVGMGTDAVQTLTITGATGGTFALAYTDYRGVTQTTSAIAYDATSATVQAALEALSLIGTGGVTVTGDGPHVITFDGTATKARPQDLIVCDDSLLTGAGSEDGTVANTTTGVADWIRAGFTENGVQLDYSKNTQIKRVDQHTGPIEVFIDEEDAKFVFEIAERDLLAFLFAIGTATISHTTQSATQSALQQLKVGGGTLEEFQFVAEGKSPEDLPLLIHCTRAKSIGNFTDRRERGKANNLSCEVMILEDETLAEGQTMFSIYSMAAVAA